MCSVRPRDCAGGSLMGDHTRNHIVQTPNMGRGECVAGAQGLCGRLTDGLCGRPSSFMHGHRFDPVSFFLPVSVGVPVAARPRDWARRPPS